MIKIVITKDDLDDKTIKVVDNKLTAPGAEIEVLDRHDIADTDTHYYEGATKLLKHVETGAVWQAEVGKMKERAAPRNEELTADSEVNFLRSVEDNKWTFDLHSAVSGKFISEDSRLAGNYTERTGIFAEYANAKEANADLATKKLTVTTSEYFADNVEGKPKILATTFELPYPAIPYKEGKANADLNVRSHSGEAELVFNDNLERQAAMNVEKTFNYKFVDFSGREYEGTHKTTGLIVHIEDCEPSLRWYNLNKATYSLVPYQVEYFFGNIEVAPDTASAENTADHL